MNNPFGFQPPTNNQEIPQEKNNKIPPKSHSLSQAKTSELPPTAKYHFVVN